MYGRVRPYVQVAGTYKCGQPNRIHIDKHERVPVARFYVPIVVLQVDSWPSWWSWSVDSSTRNDPLWPLIQPRGLNCISRASILKNFFENNFFKIFLGKSNYWCILLRSNYSSNIVATGYFYCFTLLKTDILYLSSTISTESYYLLLYLFYT